MPTVLIYGICLKGFRLDISTSKSQNHALKEAKGIP